MSKFQSTLPRRKRHYTGGLQKPITNFNPRFREGSDSCGSFLKPKTSISIHASAKEATYTPTENRYYEPISIHASAKEATGSAGKGIFPLDFNPRFREGSDKDAECREERDLVFQSTLPRRKRLRLMRRGRRDTNFNPRFREGSDGY